MNGSFNARAAAFVLRAALGVMYLTHGLVLKVFMYGISGTTEFFVSIGLPGFFAWLTILAETVGGVLILAGVRTAYVSVALIPILIGATWVHAGNGWVFSEAGGGWEYPVFLIATSVALALLAWPERRPVRAAVPAA